VEKAEHSRLESTVRVKYSDLLAPEGFEADDIYTKLYQGAALGEIACGYTRVDEAAITQGFYRRSHGVAEHVIDKPSKSVEWMADRIRGGSRPPLSLYWNPLCPHDSKLVCPDDQLMLAAYRLVGIRKVPAQVLGPRKSSLQESALTFKGFNLRDFDGVMAIQAQGFVGVSGAGEDGLSDDMRLLASLCGRALAAIKAFHADAGIGSHYHQALFARVYRHKRCLESIAGLLEIGNVDHAVVLTRILYEGFLEFYLDWLAPNQMGPVIHYVSLYERSRGSKNTDELRHPREYVGGLYDLISNVKRKASVSCLGVAFYELAYPALSSVVHQGYNELDLEHGDFVEQLGNLTWQKAAATKWSNIITAEFLSRVGDEIATDLLADAAGVA